MNIKIYIKSMNQSTVGFTQENNYTLEFILPKNSSQNIRYGEFKGFDKPF